MTSLDCSCARSSCNPPTYQRKSSKCKDMETLSLRPLPSQSEDSSYRRKHGSTQQLSRLPTPEASTSSTDTADRDETKGVVSPTYIQTAYDASAPNATFSQRRDSHTTSVRNSPPYQSMDSQRTSLPPIKALLGDTLTSPPQTPHLNNVSRQPSPFEPSFISDTYKPPALYPNKKPRKDFTFEPVAPITNGSCFSSPGVTAAAFGQAQKGLPSGSTRPSIQRSVTEIHLHADRGRESVTRAHARGSENYLSHSERLPTGMPHSSLPYFANQMRRSSYDDMDERDPANQYDESYSYQPNTQLNPPPDGGYVDRNSMLRFGREEIYGPSDVSMASRHGPQSSYFVPDHYEYQHGKSRKRSNLPKQSTEVMKTWFDQNISNPYPSEEQKAMFSNATGISMTQVSNWFINHRRRCPELRDKRDKTRGRE